MTDTTTSVVDEVRGAGVWADNAALIEDLVRLDYLHPEQHILDPTFGNGTWWKRWAPRRLTAHDIKLDGSDFRHLPYAEGTFDVIAYDPPYVSKGGRATSTLQGHAERYGIDVAPKSPAALQLLINEGLTEMTRLVKPGGIILVKVMDYISSGKVWEACYYTLTHAKLLGLATLDRFEFVTEPGPQPMLNPNGSARRQVHARRNHSTMFVFRRTLPKSQQSYTVPSEEVLDSAATEVDGGTGVGP